MSTSSRVTTTYDSYGNVTDVNQYDFGASTRTVDTNYVAMGSSWNGSACVAIGSGINDRPCAVHKFDSTGAYVGNTNFTYDSKGNVLTRSTWASGPVSGGLYLNTNYTYNANGTVATSTDVNGAITSYAYNGTGGCNNGFPTSITAQLNLTTSCQWNCNIGKVTQTTDPNNTTTTSAYNDALLRTTSITDPLNNVTNKVYNDPPLGGWIRISRLTATTLKLIRASASTVTVV